jgi:hypothetical protein
MISLTDSLMPPVVQHTHGLVTQNPGAP